MFVVHSAIVAEPGRAGGGAELAAGAGAGGWVFALANDTGADDYANILRPLWELLLDLAKPHVHAAPSAPASSAITDREHATESVLDVFSDFYIF